jgi:hypothetical protein
MRSLLFLAVVVLLCGSADAQPVITEDAKLVRSGTSNFANPGWSIAAAEGFVVLGGRLDDSVYVFREAADGWEEEAALSASEPSFFTFGQAVGAWSDGREDLVIVGARGDGLMPDTDKAYIFQRDKSSEWVEEARLMNGPDVHEAFGSAVAIHGDFAVVGAFGADDVGETTGAAYTYKRTSEGAWVEDARLLASDASAPAGFGAKVAIVVSSEGIPFTLAGAPSDSDQQGAAYAFRRTPDGTWVEEAKLVEPDPEPDTGGLFGRAVALAETPEGDILALAGELGDQGSGIQSGAGYVFRRAGNGTWTFEAKLTAADGQSGQRLGWSVALAAAPAVGSTVAVLGADGAYNFAGTVRLFRRTAGATGPVWTEEAELWASDRRPGDTLGESVGASSRYAVAGAPYNDGEGGPSGPGAGYVWDLQRAVPVEPSAETPNGRVQLTVYPNPVDGGQATVQLRLPTATDVQIDAFDVLGREVAVLHDGPLAAGRHTFRLATAALPSGVYLLRLSGETSTVTRRVVVLR